MSLKSPAAFLAGGAFLSHVVVGRSALRMPRVRTTWVRHYHGVLKISPIQRNQYAAFRRNVW